MIRLSNLRLEHDVPFEYGKSQSRIICDLEADFTDVKSFWFSVDTEFGCWLTADVYDSFLVAMLYPAMYYGEDIDDEKLSWGINYNELIAPIVLVIQKQQEKINMLEKQIKDLADSLAGGGIVFNNLLTHIFTARKAVIGV